MHIRNTDFVNDCRELTLKGYTQNNIIQFQTVQKENIETSTLGLVFNPSDQTVYIKIKMIGERTYREFMEVLEEYVYTKKMQ